MNTKTAVVWDTDMTDEKVVSESIDWDDDLSLEDETESVLTPDRRTRVEERHYAPGGKYRGVLKIHVQYGKNEKNWNAGTGWLLKDDLVVTAGHVVLSKLQKRRAVYLKAYAGYHGLGSVDDKPGVQQRWANRVVVIKAYYQDQSSIHDVAFVKLREPFDNIQPFTHCNTPERGTGSLSVVGYPGDKDRYDLRDLGPFMYEQSAHTYWNLHISDSNLLSYAISTNKGQSGGPVILDNNNSQCIGTHIEGFRRKNPRKNSASTIGGQYGNPYNALLEAIEVKPLHISGGVWEVSLSREGPPENQKRKDSQHTSKTRAQPVAFFPGPSTLRRKEDVFARLQQYDTLFLVDDSASMMSDDSVTGNKWEITKNAMAEITSIAVEHNSEGVEVQFFNSYLKPPKGKNLRSAEEVMSLFEDLKIYGPSPIADRLDEVLNEYCFEFEKNRRIKGFNLIVLTDEKPKDDQDVEAVIVKFARKLENKSVPLLKVGIQFVQIGNDPEAAAYFKPLDDTLKARYKLDRDTVDTVLWVEGGSEPLHQKVLLGGILRWVDNA